ncbi:carbonic anhydrase [Syncephalastrum racemosum]|uniref:Carbonic anhydrase n=1 Tax=Syncephalastrum racemosum TaxID=13706 RepID=A0A1X2H2G7_SYNRA|nr:carbonic anhydrase [Syncephalastrum racemosum]
MAGPMTIATGDDEGMVKNGNKVIAGAQSGALHLWQWDEWASPVRRWLGHPSSIDTMCRLGQDSQASICTGSSDGLLRRVSLSSSQVSFDGILGDHGEDLPIERVRSKSQLLASCGHDLQPTVTLNKFDPNDENLSKLLENNRAWAAQVNKEAPDFFKQSNQGQSPKILWIGCSDSRVPAEQILQLGPGEVFVHRNIANVVTNSDFSCLSVVQYAVEVLKVQHIVVCGHYNCGGVAAAHGHTQVGLIDNWLRNIKDVYRLNSKELQGISDEKQRMRRLVELNAINSAKTVSNTTIVQNAWKNGQKLTVHAWAHDLADGLARPLDWRVSDAKALEDIYVM